MRLGTSGTKSRGIFEGQRLCRRRRRRRIALTWYRPGLKVPLVSGNTTGWCGCPAANSQFDVRREVTPHSTAGFGDIVLRDLKVQIGPPTQQAAARHIRSALSLESESTRAQTSFCFSGVERGAGRENLLFKGKCLAPVLAGILARGTAGLALRIEECTIRAGSTFRRGASGPSSKHAAYSSARDLRLRFQHHIPRGGW